MITLNGTQKVVFEVTQEELERKMMSSEVSTQSLVRKIASNYKKSLRLSTDAYIDDKGRWMLEERLSGRDYETLLRVATKEEVAYMKMLIRVSKGNTGGVYE